MEGVYRLSGFTRNSSDGNTTPLSNFVLFLKDGRLSGTGYYDSGSNYNDSSATNWTGTYTGDSVEWTENTVRGSFLSTTMDLYTRANSGGHIVGVRIKLLERLSLNLHQVRNSRGRKKKVYLVARPV